MQLEPVYGWTFVRRTLVVLAVGLLLAVWVAQIEGAPGIPYYALWHTFFEVAAMVIAGMVFAVGWTTKRMDAHGGVFLMAMGFLAVAVFDFSHAMSAVGMPDYITPNSVDKSIYFWLAARFTAAFALLAAGWVSLNAMWRGWDRWASATLPRGAALAVVLVWLVCVQAWFLVWPETVPTMFVPGTGLTALKVGLEYGLVALFLLAAGLFYRLKNHPHINMPLLVGAAAVMAMSEILFTLYATADDIYNLLGHLYKVVAYWMLYQGVFVTTVTLPYRAMDASREHLQALIEAVPDLMFELDDKGCYLGAHASQKALLAAPIDTLVGKTVFEVLPLAAAETVMQALAKAREQGAAYGFLITLPVPDGAKWFELSVSLKGQSGQGGWSFLVLSRDVTQRVKEQDSLRKFSLAVEQNPNAIIVTDTNACIQYVNRAFTAITGYTLAEVEGQNPRMFASGQTPPDVYRELWDHIAEGYSWRGEFINRRKDGTVYNESTLIFPVIDDRGLPLSYLAIKEDVTERKKTAQRIEQLSNFDVLTGLPNRTYFANRFQQLLSLTERAHGHLTLLHLDIDNFKQINESLGHRVGDDLLVAVAERLLSTLRDEDTLCRQSGDEFMVALPLTDDRRAVQVTKELQQVLLQPFRVDHYDLVVTCSVGIATYPEDGNTFDGLTQRADTALHRAKQDGRGSYRFFAEDMQSKAAEVLQLENGLRSALQARQLEVHFQPQMRIDDERMIGVEALLRWKHPEKGNISPAVFIPVAEASGQIVGIGAWVMRTSAAQAQRWRLERGVDVTVAVNLSMAQFRHESLVDLVRDVLVETGLPAHLLELELTESIAMEEPEHVVHVLGRLQSLGVTLSIDDFGTGYSSFSYLKRLHVQKLKIDQSFVRNITVDGNDASIVKAIVSMAHSLGIGTIAEGVETAEQLEVLRALGCDEAQGWLFSPARPAQDLGDWLDRARNRVG